MSSSGPNRSSTSAIATGRLGRIVRGYLGACFVAAWALPFGLILEDLLAGHHVSGRFTDFGIVVGGFFIVMLVSAAPLATAAIVATETWRTRVAWPFLVAGAGIGTVIQAVATFLVRSPPSATAGGVPTSASPTHWAIFVLVALVGGIAGAIYWAIAVRGTRPPQLRD